jgi:hypothetical protein
MSDPQWPNKPDNSILVAGVPLEMEYEAYGTIFPGDLVEFETTTCKVKAAQADSNVVLGIADLAMASITQRGASRANAYIAGDQVKVISGPIIVIGRLVASADITCGDNLQAAPSGEIKEFVCGTDNACQLIGQSIETLAVDTENYQFILVRWLR